MACRRRPGRSNALTKLQKPRTGTCRFNPLGHLTLHSPGRCCVGAWTVRLAIEVGCTDQPAQALALHSVYCCNILRAGTVLANIRSPIVVERREFHSNYEHRFTN